MYFVPEGQHDSSQARSAWDYEENSPVPAGRLNRSWLRNHHEIQNQVEHPRRRTFPQEYEAFLKRHEHSTHSTHSTRCRLLRVGALSLAHAGAAFRRQIISELTMPSTVPPGRGLSASLPRHFVPGYYRAVPPGQNHSPSEAPRIKPALMG